MAKNVAGRKVAIAIIAVVVIAVVAYSLFPYVVSTKISNLATNKDAYVYGTVGSRVSIGTFNAFNMTDGTGSVLVIWNGTLPSPGTKILVHGHVNEYTFLFAQYKVIEADSVYQWPF